jgi:hypothetical protein
MSRSRSAKSELTTLPNIGSEIAKMLKKIGIKIKKDFLQEDPFEVFHALHKRVDPTLCRCILASIVGAKMGVQWHAISEDTAREYKRRYPQHKLGACPERTRGAC